MGVEYKIKFKVPDGYDASRLFDQLPPPFERGKMVEIYNYSVESDGFYFIDHMVNVNISSLAFRRFVDEALRLSQAVEIVEP